MCLKGLCYFPIVNKNHECLFVASNIWHPFKVQASVSWFWYIVQIFENLDKVEGNFSQ